MEAIPVKILIGILITAAGIFGAHYVANVNPVPSSVPVIATPAPTLSPLSIATSQPTYQPTQPVVRQVVVTPDPDPIVSCDIGANCGGYKQMRQNECRASVCCQVGNSWSLYPDKQSCTNAQVQALPPEPAETPWPILPPTTPYPSISTYTNQQALTDCLNSAKMYIEGPDFNVGPNPNSAQLEMQGEDEQSYNNAVATCHNEYGN